jgi:YD repeat-containing protein
MEQPREIEERRGAMLGRIQRDRSLLVIPALSLIVLLLLPNTAIAATSFTYDPLGRVTTALYGNGTCIAYGYDANGNRTSQTNTVGGAPVTAAWGACTWGCFSWTP